MSTEPKAYRHRQRSVLIPLLLYGTGLALAVGGWAGRHESWPTILLWPMSVLTLVLATAFHHLTVVDVGTRLLVHFGPLSLFWKTVPYEEIERVEIGTTTLLEGWGIHLSPRGGWVWNLSGWDCVVLHLRRSGTLRLGTDDPAGLKGYLDAKLTCLRPPSMAKSPDPPDEMRRR